MGLPKISTNDKQPATTPHLPPAVRHGSLMYEIRPDIVPVIAYLFVEMFLHPRRRCIEVGEDKCTQEAYYYIRKKFHCC